MAFNAIELNFYISFSGIITFKNASSLRETVKKIPIERILIETDSPWLAPIPFRGKKNEPKYVIEVAKTIAQIKGITLEEVCEKTTLNYKKLFFKG
jgi:TatD DNase family protein